jgi:hypothetical protein
MEFESDFEEVNSIDDCHSPQISNAERQALRYLIVSKICA